MNSVVNSFKTVARASAVTHRVITEGRPVVNTGQHVVSAGSNVRLSCLKNAKKDISSKPTNVKRNYLLLETSNIIGCIGSLCRWVAYCGRPITEIRWKRRIDRMENIVVQRVTDSDFLAVGSSDHDLWHCNNFIRRDGFDSPVPERMTKRLSGLLPGILINSVSRRNTHGI